MRSVATVLTVLASVSIARGELPQEFGAVGSAAGLAAGNRRPAIPLDIRVLVDDLGSPDYRVRERAGKAIAALGDRALPHLKNALPLVDDPEANRRLQVIVKRQEEARLTQPRRVTFKATNKTLKEVLEEFGKRSGYPIRYDGGGDEKQKVSFEFNNKPFWEAFDEICNSTGLSANQQDEDGTLSVYFTDSYNPYVSYDGPFKVIATHINTGKSVQLSGINRKQPMARQPEFISLNFSVMAEPKTPLVGVGQPYLTKAIDDTGASLLNPDPDGSLRSQSQYPPQASYLSFVQGFGTSLTKAERNATLIKELRGTVQVAIMTDVRPEITVDSILKVKNKRFNGRTTDLEIGTVEWNNGVLNLGVTFRQRNGDPEDYSWMNGLMQKVEITDAVGRKYNFGGVNTQQNGPGVVMYQLQFMPPQGDMKIGEPHRLRLVEWVTMSREVEFKFKDVTLP